MRSFAKRGFSGLLFRPTVASSACFSASNPSPPATSTSTANHHAVEDLPKSRAGTDTPTRLQLGPFVKNSPANAPYPVPSAGREACTMRPVHGFTMYDNAPSRDYTRDLTWRSNGHRWPGHLQAHQVRRQIHRYPDSWYAAITAPNVHVILNYAQVTVSVLRSPSRSRRSSRRTTFPLSGSRSTSPVSRLATSTPRSSSASPLLRSSATSSVSRVSSTLPSSDLVTARSTSLSARNSTSTPLLSCSRTSPATRRATRTSTSALSVRTPRASTLVSSTSRSTASLSRLRSSPVRSRSALPSLLSPLRSQTTARRSPASTRPTS
jgi:hypothetical protein